MPAESASEAAMLARARPREMAKVVGISHSKGSRQVRRVRMRSLLVKTLHE